MGVTITEEKFGTTQSGKEVTKYILENSNGVKIAIINYGASIQSIIVPDKNGKFDDIALGYEGVKDYEDDKCYLGALCGRVANRISNAQFTIDGVTSHLTKNDGDNHIHGGNVGFNKKVFKCEIRDGRVQMYYTSPKGEEGYPGTMTVVANYELNEGNELHILLTAVSTHPTAVNLVQHTYFNLGSSGAENVYDHILTVDAEKYTLKKENGYPSGEITSVAGTCFDFRKPKRIGDDIEKADAGGVGFDHNLCLKTDRDSVSRVAKLQEPDTGRVLEVSTNQPGLQVYTSYYLGGERGKKGACHNKFRAICLETQNYPDAINQENFPNAVVRPQDGYNHNIVYKFSTE